VSLRAREAPLLAVLHFSEEYAARTSKVRLALPDDTVVDPTSFVRASHRQEEAMSTTQTRTRTQLTPHLAALLMMAGTLLASSAARAAQTKEQLCADVARTTTREREKLWMTIRSAADRALCRKPALLSRPEELIACGTPRIAPIFQGLLLNAFEGLFKKVTFPEWAALAPRGISEDWEEGTIQVGARRIFLGAAHAYGTARVELQKEGGKAPGNVTVCELDYAGNVIASYRKTFPDGKGNEGALRTVEVNATDNRLLAIVVDTPAGTDAFEYRARLWNRPTRSPKGPLDPKKGPYIADTHVHQFANLAFAGRLLWGQHDGDPAVALGSEVVNPPGPAQLDSFQSLVAQAAAFRGALDANVASRLFKPLTTDEGYFRVGGEGYPTFKDWPHHADRSHQQAYITWLDHARKRGLKLMVVSIVHNDFLCRVMSALDPYGNVPELDASGRRIAGQWDSSTWNCTDDESVRRQLRAIHELEAKYPWYRVAMHPWHARRIISEGGLAVMVSLETDKPLSNAAGIYTANGWRDTLDQYQAMGLSSLQIVHESDSPFAGAAPHRDDMETLQKFHWPATFLGNEGDHSPFHLDGQHFNQLGLTPMGQQLVDEMVDRSLPIDLAHMSVRAREDVLGRVPKTYGVYDSHTKFQRLLKTCGPDDGDEHVAGPGPKCAGNREQEFVITEGLIPEYVKHQVLVGLRASSIDVLSAPNARVANTCAGSARSFAQMVQYASDRGLSIAFGTDMNTGVSQLGPRFGEGACWAASNAVDPRWRSGENTPDGPGGPSAQPSTLPSLAGRNYQTDGLAHIGLLPDLANDLKTLGTPGANALLGSAETFLAMWERAYPPDGEMEPAEGEGKLSIPLGGSCTAGDQCESGHCTGVAGLKGKCACNEDRDCGKGKFCNMGADAKANACETKAKDNESCPLVDGGAACLSGQCAWAHCYTPRSADMGETCYVDDACRLGKCNALDGARGICVCKGDDDCGAGRYCDSGADLTDNSCHALKDDNESCALAGGDHQCRGGHCTWSRCYTPDSVPMGGTCYTDDACSDGKCSAMDGTRGSCVCKSDEDCDSGEWCDGGVDTKLNACRVKLGKGEYCGSFPSFGNDHKCKSGSCSGVFRYECK
jgi:microsomal dipeptidase-like Zn-dependent dipeptidase